MTIAQDMHFKRMFFDIWGVIAENDPIRAASHIRLVQKTKHGATGYCIARDFDDEMLVQLTARDRQRLADSVGRQFVRHLEEKFGKKRSKPDASVQQKEQVIRPHYE